MSGKTEYKAAVKTMDGYDVKIFTDDIEESAIEQIERLLSIGVFDKCKIRVMSDVHAGAGCVIGFTGNLGDKVVPNIVGVDLGCGLYVQPFKLAKPIDYHALNEFILHNVPSGRDHRDSNYVQLKNDDIETYYSPAKQIVNQLICKREIKDIKRLYKSIGSLGGGNHFIELDIDDDGMYYLVIHTGSRNLGKQVADIYQKLAVKCQCGWAELMEKQKELIKEYKAAGRKNEIQDAIRELHASFRMGNPPIPRELSYLQGEFREQYLHDMRLCQEWAQLNRRLISKLIMGHLAEQGCVASTPEQLAEMAFESVHNYIGDDNIIRKGAISAYKGQRCIIPMNMRDGSLICIGKGNEDWNNSAPHGAGRLMSRAQAFHTLSMDDYRSSMEGIYTESVNDLTLDEAPMVYKPMDEIIANIHDTVDIEKIIKPVYNFKAAENSNRKAKTESGEEEEADESPSETD